MSASEKVVVGGERITHAQNLAQREYMSAVDRYRASVRLIQSRRGDVSTLSVPTPQMVVHGLKFVPDSAGGWVSTCGRFTTKSGAQVGLRTEGDHYLNQRCDAVFSAEDVPLHGTSVEVTLRRVYPLSEAVDVPMFWRPEPIEALPRKRARSSKPGASSSGARARAEQESRIQRVTAA